MPDGLDHAMDEARRTSQEAMRAQASQGSTRQGVIEAGVRAMLERAVECQDPDLTKLEEALGMELDPGAFSLGMQAAAAVMERTDIFELMALPGARKLFLEHIELARQRHDDYRRSADVG